MNLNQKYRPQKFNDVIEQQQIVDILTQEIKNNNLKPAYLFVGKSGAGKTTLAKIFATTINAFKIEIDAASNNSADKLRQILDELKYKQLHYDKTVLILDEVHVLSNTAYQTLLTTMEQPPSHVIIIACTTEVDKIPKTIYNRCEVFTFYPITTKGIFQRLKYIADQEQIKYDEKALNYIAKQSNGSLRQAITFLDKYSSNDITLDTVRIDNSYDSFLSLFFATADKDITTIKSILDNITDIDTYVQQLFTFILDMEVYVRTKQRNLIDLPDCYLQEFDKLTTNDIKLLTTIRKDLTDLQYYGRNNPILKQILLSVLLEVIT